MSLNIQNLIKALPLATSAGLVATCVYANSSKDSFVRVEKVSWICRSILTVAACIKAYQISVPFHPPITFMSITYAVSNWTPSKKPDILPCWLGVITACTVAYFTIKKCIAVANRYPPLSPNINLNPLSEPGVPNSFTTRQEQLKEAMAFVYSILTPRSKKLIGEKWKDQSINALTDLHLNIQRLVASLARTNYIDPDTLDLNQATGIQVLDDLIQHWKTIGTVLEEIINDEARWDVNWAVKPWQLKIQTLLALNIVGALVLKIAHSIFFGPSEYLELAGLFFAFCAISRPKFIELRKILVFNDPQNRFQDLKQMDLRAYFPACFTQLEEKNSRCCVCQEEFDAANMSSPAVVTFGCEGNHPFHSECIALHIREKTALIALHSFRYQATKHSKGSAPTSLTNIKYTAHIDPATLPDCPLCKQNLKNLVFTANSIAEKRFFFLTREIEVPAEILLAAQEE